MRNITKSRACAASLCTEGGCMQGLRGYYASRAWQRGITRTPKSCKKNITRMYSKIEVMLMLKPERVVINKEVVLNHHSVAQVNMGQKLLN